MGAFISFVVLRRVVQVSGLHIKVFMFIDQAKIIRDASLDSDPNNTNLAIIPGVATQAVNLVSLF